MWDTAKVTLSWPHVGIDAIYQWALSLLPQGVWLLCDIMAPQVESQGHFSSQPKKSSINVDRWILLL